STRTRTRLPRRSVKSAIVFFMPGSSLVLANHVLQEIDATIRVAPFVVVPADELEEAAVQLDAAAGVEDAGIGVMDEVAGNNLVFGVGQNALEVRLGSPLHGVTDFLVTRFLDRAHGQIDY